jgi:hypothetical protein
MRNPKAAAIELDKTMRAPYSNASRLGFPILSLRGGEEEWVRSYDLWQVIIP